MADAQSALQRSGLTRGKAAAIGILAVVLVGVLYMQYGTSGAAPSSDPVGYRPRRPVPTPPVNQSQNAAAEKKGQTENGPPAAVAAVVDETRWKSPNLADVVDYDPFALPPAFPRPQVVDAAAMKAKGLVEAAAEDDAKKLADAVAQLQMQWEQLKQRGVHVIVRDRDHYVAVIGDLTVHVGDEIDGYTITEIDPQGVHVERKATQ